MWKPLIEADEGAPFWALIEEIRQALLSLEETGPPDPTLTSGLAGRALFFSYLDAQRPGSEDSDHALALLSEAVAALPAVEGQPSLFAGFSGVGWVLEHLAGELFEDDPSLAAGMDRALAPILAPGAEPHSAELVLGLSGYGVYLLERGGDAPPGHLTRLLDRLAETAEVTPQGVSWHTPARWLSPEQRQQLPGGLYNLGVAHGVPGVLGFLAAAARAGVADPRLAELAEGAVSWLLAQRLPEGQDSVFPSIVVPGQEPAPTRTGWCYGDLGVAVVLFAAARTFGRPDWEAEALRVAHLAAQRPLTAVRANDAGLCHGTAGIAHLFNRLYQASGDPLLRNTARAWLERTAALHHPGEGLAGFQALVPERPGEIAWRPLPGFLVGIAGIGLALLAALTEGEPSWDRVLLADLAPAAPREDA